MKSLAAVASGAVLFWGSAVAAQVAAPGTPLWTPKCPPPGIVAVVAGVRAEERWTASREFFGPSVSNPNGCLMRDSGAAVPPSGMTVPPVTGQGIRSYNLQTSLSDEARDAIVNLKPTRNGNTASYTREMKDGGGQVTGFFVGSVTFDGIVPLSVDGIQRNAARVRVHEASVLANSAGEHILHFDTVTGVLLGQTFQIVRGEPSRTPDWQVTRLLLPPPPPAPDHAQPAGRARTRTTAR